MLRVLKPRCVMATLGLYMMYPLTTTFDIMILELNSDQLGIMEHEHEHEHEHLVFGQPILNFHK